MTDPIELNAPLNSDASVRLYDAEEAHLRQPKALHAELLGVGAGFAGAGDVDRLVLSGGDAKRVGQRQPRRLCRRVARPKGESQHEGGDGRD